jgi:membrane protease YdiL (CAAX protease family)
MPKRTRSLACRTVVRTHASRDRYAGHSGILALVAFSEEIMFRRLAREMLCPWLGDHALMVLATSLMFGAYHWWAGLGAVTSAAICGVFLMVLYQRSGALWPVVLAHYLVDLYFFA